MLSVVVDTGYHQYNQSINQSINQLCNLKTQEQSKNTGNQCFHHYHHQSLNFNSAVGFRDTGVVCGVKLNARGPVLLAELGASLSTTFLCPLLRCAMTPANAVTAFRLFGFLASGKQSSAVAIVGVA